MNRTPRSDHEVRKALEAKDETVLSELIDRFGDHLFKLNRRKFPGLDEQEIDSAIYSLMLRLWDHPQMFDPDRGSLAYFLDLVLKRSLQKMLVKEKKKPLSSAFGVELLQNRGNNEWREIESEIDQPGRLAQIEEVLDTHFPTEPDRTFARLILRRERKREKFAEVLGIKDLTGEDWIKKVDRIKDRTKKKIKRNDIINIIYRIANS